MERLLSIHVPGLSVPEHYPLARRRLMCEFRDVREVLATTAPETLLVLHSGPERREAWCRTLVDVVHSAHADDRDGREPRRRHWFRFGGGTAA